MLTFTGYEKIAESVAKWGLDAKGYRALRRAPWAVTEKIHGANFCFVVANGTVRGANRRRLLADDEPFFGWQTVRDRLADSLRDAATHLPDAESVTVYGELFGGGYPHEGVASAPAVQPVQTGVWYAPDIRFAAFDVAVARGDERRYLDFEQAQTVLRAAGVPCVAPLFVGTFERATDFSPRFDSTISATLGLPPLPSGTNLAEGIVVRPVREIAGLPVRPLVKIKIAEFAETRFHEAQKWDALTDAAGYSGTSIDRMKWEAYNRITENRLDATVSKIGNTPERRGEVCAFLLNEVMSEAQAAAPLADAALSVAERDEWQRYVRGEVRSLLATRYGNK